MMGNCINARATFRFFLGKIYFLTIYFTMHFEKINIHLNLFKSRIISNLKYCSDTYEINVIITLLHETHHWLLGRGDLGFEGHGMLQPSATSGFDIQNLITGSGTLLGGGKPSRVTNFTPADSVQ